MIARHFISLAALLAATPALADTPLAMSQTCLLYTSDAADE